ncbi:uncharacterized protein Dvar_49420 [Desulfosarcina variabilis str. Montpellier]|uniref:hypothetical protein n=1 Tax=Desulfosarcina variabilis TaxID=2300 RepID=UPI003AFA07D1
MTYNFDPDRWLDNELDALDVVRKTGKLSAADCDKQKDALMQRYDAMVARLDGTYQVMKE